MHDVDAEKDGRISQDEFSAMMKAGADWRKASRQYSREHFNSLSLKLFQDDSLTANEAQGIEGKVVSNWGRRPAALQALSQRLSRGFNEALNGFIDKGWSMIRNDGIDDVTVLVNASPVKLMALNLTYADGFPVVSNTVLCAKASMLLQVRSTKSGSYNTITL